MWLLINSTLENEKLLIIAGRSLCLCQKFETTCKDIIMWLSSAKFVFEKKVSLLDDDYSDYVEELIKRQLGQSINKFELEVDIGIEPNEMGLLKKGKDSRNFICHEFLKDLILASFSSKKGYNPDLKILKTHIRNIATADYLVSKWSYEFHEKESGDFFDQEKYVKGLIDWVIK
jgi:hypothetical protein